MLKSLGNQNAGRKHLISNRFPRAPGGIALRQCKGYP